jgi:hypothetical protein
MRVHFEACDGTQLEVMGDLTDNLTVRMVCCDYDDYTPTVHLDAADVKDVVNMLQDWLQQQEEA